MSTTARDIYSNLTPEQQEEVLALAITLRPIAYFSFFENDRKREGKKDADFTGRLDLTVSSLRLALAEAEAKGHRNVQIYADLWIQHDGSGEGPVMSGKARNVVPDEKRFEPTPRVARVTEETGSEEGTEPTGDDIPF